MGCFSLFPTFSKKKVTKIQISTFFNCQNLSKIEIPNSSCLLCFDVALFRGSSIESINIPPSVTTNDDVAFYQCKHLKVVNILPSSKLSLISRLSFYQTSIEKLIICSEIIHFKYGAFNE